MSGDAPFLGALFLALAALLVVRVVRALQTGEVPVYRKRITRAEAGPARFRTVVMLNILLAIVLVVLAADLFFDLGLRPL